MHPRLCLRAAAAALLILASVPGRAAEPAAALPAEPKKALTVIVAPVEERLLKNDIAATGNVVAWREMPIGSETSGLAVTEIAADEGDVVTKGQVLARLNRRILKAQVQQSEAAIRELEASLANAQSDLHRARSVTSGVISAQTVEQRETLVRTTEAKLLSARAMLKEIEARLAQTDVVAPSDGIVASRNVTLGQVVQAGTEMFRLIQDSRIEVDALVPEADLLRVKPRQAVAVIDPTGKQHSGTVRLVAPMVDAKTRLGTVHVALPKGTELKPGMFARVEIKTEGATALAVPLKALVWRDGKPAVFTVSGDGKVALTEITTGRKTSEFVEVSSGIERGHRIVVEGAGLLNHGDTVRTDVAATKDTAEAAR